MHVRNHCARVRGFFRCCGEMLYSAASACAEAGQTHRLLTPDKKKTMLREIIKVTHEAVGSGPSSINVVILEVGPADDAINGEVF